MDSKEISRPGQEAQYLVFYNLISAVLWLAILGRTALLVPLVGFENVHGGVGEFTKWTQTLALLEIVHSALGMKIDFLTQEIINVVVQRECPR